MERLFLLLAASVLFLNAEPLAVASAKGYKKPMMKLFRQFETRKGIKITPIFGNMRQVIAQTELSGKVALVVGDRDFLRRSSLPVADYVPLGRGRLVLAYPKGRALKTINGIAGDTVRKIALPDPKKAIYGKAAMQALRNSGLAEKVADRLLTVGTVPQVSSYLIADEIDAGFINLTDALGIREKIGGYITVDTKLYTPIRIVCAVITGHENDPQAKAFVAFLNTPEARALLEASGL
jgi:molybdate transport system substrate-binding protein